MYTIKIHFTGDTLQAKGLYFNATNYSEKFKNLTDSLIKSIELFSFVFPHC